MDISEADIYAAMQRISGYIDISTGDFLEVYRLANDNLRQRLFGHIRADDLLRDVPAPLTPNLTLGEAIQRMSEQGLTSIPVVNDGNRVVGVLSDCIVLRHLGFETVHGLLAGVCGSSCRFIEKSLGIRVSIVMTSPVVTLRDNAAYDEIAEAFRVNENCSIPLVDDRDRLRGVLKRTDFVRLCMERSGRQHAISTT